MDFSGAINWGDVVAEIVISDVVKIGGHIASAKAAITINGQSKALTFEWHHVD